MMLYRLAAEEEAFGNLRVGQTLPQQVKNLALPRGDLARLAAARAGRTEDTHDPVDNRDPYNFFIFNHLEQ